MKQVIIGAILALSTSHPGPRPMSTTTIGFVYIQQEAGAISQQFQNLDRMLVPDGSYSSAPLADSAYSPPVRGMGVVGAQTIPDGASIHAMRLYVRCKAALGGAVPPVVRIVECLPVRDWEVVSASSETESPAVGTAPGTFAFAVTIPTTLADIRADGFGMQVRFQNQTGDAEVTQIDVDGLWAEVDWSVP